MSGEDHVISNSQTEEGTEMECTSARRLDSCNASQSNAPIEKVGQKDWEPKVGMIFETWSDAYHFYCEYAKNVGFSVRIQGGNKSKSGVFKNRLFVCSFEGHRAFDKRRIHVKYRRDNRRTGCEAQLTIVLQDNGKYCVSKFEGTHNHPVLNPRISHMLRTQGKVTVADATHSKLSNSPGIHPKPKLILPKPTLESVNKQAGEFQNLGLTHADYNNYLLAKRKRGMSVGGEQVERLQNLEFSHGDYNNYLDAKRKREMEKGGAGVILKYFEKMQEESRSSFHSIQLDATDQITNIFWADARMVVDYNCFGDVVCFDTTFRTNDEEPLFALFLGVNHHKQTVIFGAALLYDETINSFKWVFQSFLKAMSGKQPKTVLTDQDAAITNVIKQIFPEAGHRFCIWHIHQNAIKRLATIFSSSSSFEKDFSRCIYECEEEEGFFAAWNELLIKYDLKENIWLQGLFEVKKKWALPYGRNQFCADMKSTQRSENIDNSWRGYLKLASTLSQIFKQFEKAVANCRLKELEMDIKMSQSVSHLPFPIQMLKQVASIYTPTVYKVFEKEYSEALDSVILSKVEAGTTIKYRVKYCNRPYEHVVTFDSSNLAIVCSCKKFEFVGIVCSHALYILLERQVKLLPPQYILKRWTRYAKYGPLIDYRGCAIELEPNVGYSMMFKELQRVCGEASARAAEDKKAFLFLLDVYKHARQGLEEILKNRSAPEYGVDLSSFF
ncbi:PREDICTED: protein FAR1-RELATED SEQUENCE 5-like [Nelumbo nucifera]|uniref:Protein FAR1-RELATED SEQUENCE n=1 Tax=Nelumbo nucifera TaxID=4432 RepID=A0A1U7Z1I2_NELNU|nr:PREDICTED: protein FAR1-RELATED SEQUENCE 5-like [Nelumbo nucifera]XP_010245900.1 PREDICTED: protein FAR1-RELATED SEQUENCE 5-like [Nelumbo nucifera]